MILSIHVYIFSNFKSGIHLYMPIIYAYIYIYSLSFKIGIFQRVLTLVIMVMSILDIQRKNLKLIKVSLLHHETEF